MVEPVVAGAGAHPGGGAAEPPGGDAELAPHRFDDSGATLGREARAIRTQPHSCRWSKSMRAGVAVRST